MSIHRRHSFARGTGSARRRTTWARQIGTLSNASAATSVTSDLLAAFKTGGGTTFGCTVARIHLRLAVATVVAPGDEFVFGVIKGQDTDVGTTIAGAPTPVSHPYEDWLYWSAFFGASQAGAGSSMFDGGNNCYTIDIKAKRKLEELNENLNIVAVAPVSGAFPQQVNYSASVLLMLP
jgi:hypothetical protein